MKQQTEPRVSPLQQKNQALPVEKFSYAIYFLGQGLIYAVVSQCLMYYYNTQVHIAALTVSAILFAGKIWDAVNDTLFGLIVDSVKFKSGKKFLPWLRISTILIPLSTILLFSLNDKMSMTLRIVLAVITYLVWDTCYTICDAPIYALPTAMTSNIKERSGFMVFSSAGGALASALAVVVFVPFAEKKGYFLTAIIVSVIAFIAMSLICLFGKERYKVRPELIEKAASLKDTWEYLVHNKYLLYYYANRLITGSISVSMLIYVAKYCLGDVKWMSVIIGISAIPILIIFAFSGKIFKRFDKIVIYRFCTIVGMIIHLITLIVGYKNLYVVIGLMAASAAITILPSILWGAIPQDCVEYGTYKTGIRKEGITFALQTFANKLTAAFATMFSGVVLTIIHFDETATVIPQAAVDGMWKLNFIIPMIGQLIGLWFLFAYKLRDRDVQVMSDCNAGKITNEEAEKLLSQKY